MSEVAIIITAVISVALILLIMYFSYNNTEIALRKEAAAQLGKIQTVRDRMFQIIREQANVSVEYTEAFERIFPKIIEGRYNHNDGKLMQWIKEDNPHFDIRLYDTLKNSIEVQRTAFTATQNRLIDIIRQRDTLIESLPSCWFIRNKTTIEYEPISTSNTKQVMATRIDDSTFSFR